MVIIKATPDRELYLLWSTIADGPGWAFDSRVALREYLWSEWHSEHPHCIPEPGHGPEARMDRADLTGTSMAGGSFGWDEESWGVGDDCPHDGYWYRLPRANLVAYIEAHLADDQAAKHAQLVRGQRVGAEDEDE